MLDNSKNYVIIILIAIYAKGEKKEWAKRKRSF